eukprot:g1532.t1
MRVNTQRGQYPYPQRMTVAMTHNRLPVSSGLDSNSFPSIRLRGLPFHVTEDDIRLFLAGETVDILMVKKDGRFIGEAYVILGSPLLVDVALMKHKSYMGRRYIEIFRAKKLDYYRAVVAEMTQGPVPYDVMDSRFKRVVNYETGNTSQSQKSRNLQSSTLRLRGLPFKVTNERIVDWFHQGTEFNTPLMPESVYIVSDYGRPSGTAFVEFASREDAQLAMEKDRQMMGTRYIEIFESSSEERARYTSQ